MHSVIEERLIDVAFICFHLYFSSVCVCFNRFVRMFNVSTEWNWCPQTPHHTTTTHKTRPIEFICGCMWKYEFTIKYVRCSIVVAVVVHDRNWLIDWWRFYAANTMQYTLGVCVCTFTDRIIDSRLTLKPAPAERVRVLYICVCKGYIHCWIFGGWVEGGWWCGVNFVYMSKYDARELFVTAHWTHT